MTKLLVIGAVGLVVLAAACSNKPTAEDALIGMSTTVGEAGDAQNAAVAQAQGSNAALVQPADVQINYTGNCSAGGSVAITGDYNGDDASDATFDDTVTFDGCNNTDGTIDGDMTWTATTATDNGASDIHWAMTGNVQWVNDNGSYSCDFDLTAAITNEMESFAGQFCGYSMTLDVSARE